MVRDDLEDGPSAGTSLKPGGVPRSSLPGAQTSTAAKPSCLYRLAQLCRDPLFLPVGASLGGEEGTILRNPSVCPCNLNKSGPQLESEVILIMELFF